MTGLARRWSLALLVGAASAALASLPDRLLPHDAAGRHGAVAGSRIGGPALAAGAAGRQRLDGPRCAALDAAAAGERPR
jgi:hypothetical protein